MKSFGFKYCASVADFKHFFRSSTGLTATKKSVLQWATKNKHLFIVPNFDRFVDRFDAKRSAHWYIVCAAVDRGRQCNP